MPQDALHYRESSLYKVSVQSAGAEGPSLRIKVHQSRKTPAKQKPIHQSKMKASHAVAGWLPRIHCGAN